MVEFVASNHSVGFANTIECFENFLATVSLLTLERKETLNTKERQSAYIVSYIPLKIL